MILVGFMLFLRITSITAFYCFIVLLLNCILFHICMIIFFCVFVLIPLATIRVFVPCRQALLPISTAE